MEKERTKADAVPVEVLAKPPKFGGTSGPDTFGKIFSGSDLHGHEKTQRTQAKKCLDKLGEEALALVLLRCRRF